MTLRDPIPTPEEFRRPSELARLEMARLAVQEKQPLPEVFRRLCEIAADTLKIERVGIWLLTADRQAMRCANLFESTRREHSEGVTLRVNEFPEYFRAVEARRTLPSEFAQTDPRTAELREAYLVPLAIASMLDAPILKNGEMIGVVCHEHVGTPREWSTEERDFAMSVADAVSQKIKSAELLIARSAIRHHAELAPGGDRLEMVGRLAAGVAHDFKNLLSIVMGNAGLIARRSDLPEDVTQRARHIVDAADRGAALVHELLDFGREPNGNPRVLTVADVVEAFVPLLQSVSRVKLRRAVHSRAGLQQGADRSFQPGARDSESGDELLGTRCRRAAVIRIHVGQELDDRRRWPAERVCSNRRSRHRNRHSGHRARTNLRPVLHDKACGEGNRTRASSCSTRRRSRRWVHSRREHSWRRNNVPALPPTSLGYGVRK